MPAQDIGRKSEHSRRQAPLQRPAPRSPHAAPHAHVPSPDDLDHAAMTPQQMLTLQRSAGNAASTLVLQRAKLTQKQKRQREAEEAAAREAEAPERDPETQAVLGNQYWRKKAQGAGVKPLSMKGNNPPTSPGRSLDEILVKTGPDLLEQLGKTDKTGQLKLYRTMDREEADAILAWRGKKEATEKWLEQQRGRKAEDAVADYHAEKAKDEATIGAMPVKNHLGDWEQTDHYYKKPSSQPKTTLEFTLKEGAHHYLFSREHMAVHGDSGAVGDMRGYFEKQKQTLKTSSEGEGALTGHIGVKQEKHSAPFSLSLGKSEATQVLFQLFVEEVRDLHPPS